MPWRKGISKGMKKEEKAIKRAKMEAKTNGRGLTSSQEFSVPQIL